MTAKGGNVKSAQTTRLKVKTSKWCGCSRLSTSVLASFSPYVPKENVSGSVLPPQTPGRPLAAETRVPDRRVEASLHPWRPADRGVDCSTGPQLPVSISPLLCSPVWAKCQADALRPCLLRQHCGLQPRRIYFSPPPLHSFPAVINPTMEPQKKKKKKLFARTEYNLKTIECAIPRKSPKVNYVFWVDYDVPMQPILVNDVSKAEGYVCVWVGRTWEISMPSSLSCCKHKSALKNSLCGGMGGRLSDLCQKYRRYAWTPQ